MARYKQMRYRMLNWADWKVRQKDGIGRYARMRRRLDPEARMPWEADVVRPDEQDAWEIGQGVAFDRTSDRVATAECYHRQAFDRAGAGAPAAK